jgi:exopolyphosphatase/guanosine-5'-triphosphate,3'-diphosphate pyrophosphatase
VDIGGGSTEFIFGRGTQLLSGESFNIGAVRLTEQFISQQPTSEKEIVSARAHIGAVIQKAKALQPEKFSLEQIIAVAGTPTALAAAELGEFNPERIDGYVLTADKLADWEQRLIRSSVEEKIKMGIPAGRADVILIGVMILRQTLEIFSVRQLSVSTRGVRYGVALEMGRRYRP